MAQQLPQQRPPFYPQQAPPAPPPPRAFSPSFPSPSPGGVTSPSTPGFQPPPPKRQRTDFSPNPQSPSYVSPLLSTIQLPNTSNHASTNGAFSPPAPENRGNMPPPSRPPDKEKGTDIRTIEDSLAGTGVNIDDEERALTTFGSVSFQPNHANASFASLSSTGTNGVSFERTLGTSRDGTVMTGQTSQALTGTAQHSQLAEETIRHENNKANYIAGGRRAYELTDAFLLGDVVEKKLNARAYENGIKSPKDGLYYARKNQDAPLQKMRVVAPDGTSRVIDQGQTILSSESGPTLVNLMDLISLACKTRMTGILDLAARLGKERRDLANGRIPVDWRDVAQVPERSANPTGAQSLKRTHSQMDDGNDSPTTGTLAPVVKTFRKIADTDRTHEEARLSKRLKRTSTTPIAEMPSTPATPVPGTPGTPSDSGKKVTKKDQKVAEAKFTETQQHKYANETARMATTNLIGSNLFGSKKKTYSWMTGGPAKASPAPVATTAAKINSALSDNTQTVTNGVKPPAVVVPKGKQYGDWDDASEKPTAIPIRDILAILESDDRALKALQQGYNKPEGRE